MVSLKVNIPDDINAQLEQICRQRGCPPSEAIQDVLERWIALQRFRDDAAGIRKLAQAAGSDSEEDFFRIEK